MNAIRKFGIMKVMLSALVLCRKCFALRCQEQRVIWPVAPQILAKY